MRCLSLFEKKTYLFNSEWCVSIVDSVIYMSKKSRGGCRLLWTYKFADFVCEPLHLDSFDILNYL